MLLVGAILLAFYVLDNPWGAVLIGLAVVVEVGETFFWIWFTKRRRARVGPETLIGARAEVVQGCYPDGLVRVAGELWKAHCPAGAGVGEWVRITSLEGLTLHVEPAN